MTPTSIRGSSSCAHSQISLAADHLVVTHPAITVRVDVALRPTTDGDLATLRVFFADPGFNEQWGGQPLSDDEITAKYTGRRSPDVECFLIEQHDVPVGFVQYCVDLDGGEGGGIDMVLTPPVRGQGIGTAVVDGLIDYLQAAKAWSRITVDPDVANERGVAFWTSVGFRPEQVIDDDADRKPYLLMAWPTRAGYLK